MLKHSIQSGFTLLELMITLAIMGVIATVAVPFYRDYTIEAKLVEAIQGLDAMRADLEGNLQILKKMPKTINGIPLQHNAKMHGKATTVIEGYRYDGYDANQKYWLVVRLQQGILPEDNLNWPKREIHLGITKTSAGDWVHFCGSWDNGNYFILEKYLPSGCDEPNVNAALEAARN